MRLANRQPPSNWSERAVTQEILCGLEAHSLPATDEGRRSGAEQSRAERSVLGRWPHSLGSWLSSPCSLMPPPEASSFSYWLTSPKGPLTFAQSSLFSVKLPAFAKPSFPPHSGSSVQIQTMLFCVSYLGKKKKVRKKSRKKVALLSYFIPPPPPSLPHTVTLYSEWQICFRVLHSSIMFPTALITNSVCHFCGFCLDNAGADWTGFLRELMCLSDSHHTMPWIIFQ